VSIPSAPVVYVALGERYELTLLNTQFPVVQNFSCIMQ